MRILINPFTVFDGKEDAFLALWDQTNAILRSAPGYVSARLVRAADHQAPGHKAPFSQTGPEVDKEHIPCCESFHFLNIHDPATSCSISFNSVQLCQCGQCLNSYHFMPSPGKGRPDPQRSAA